MIPIIPGPNSSKLAKRRATTPEQTWLEYYKNHKPEQNPNQTVSEALREKITLLNVNKKFHDVRGTLVGFLTYNAKDAEPWMYSALALAYKMTEASETDVKTALNYAADLAVKGRNPNDLVSVADQMFLLGYYDRVGALIDQAAVLVPHRGEPLLMSINLAQKTKDPKRMGDSITTLLAVGWPGVDEAVRRDARKQAETLAKVLREEARGTEADALLNRLPEAEARDIFLRLTWVGDADLDLAVDEPLGATARYRTPRTVFGGSIVKNGYGNHPEEVYVCPLGFDGEYRVHVETIFNNPDKPALQASLEIITHDGTPEEHKETRIIKIGAKEPEPVKFALKGGRRKAVLPYLAPTALVPPAVARDGKGKKAEKPVAKIQEAAKK